MCMSSKEKERKQLSEAFTCAAWSLLVVQALELAAGQQPRPMLCPPPKAHIKTQSWEAPFMCRAITGKCRWPCSQEPTWLEANWAVASAQVSVKCEAERPDLHNWLHKACFSPGGFLLLLLSLLKRAERACRVHLSCWYWKASWLLYCPFFCLVQHYFYFPANFPWATRSAVCWARSKISANRP